jgi:hypothetical protein
MCTASPDTKKVMFPTTSFEMTCTVTVSFEIPCVDFDRGAIERQLTENRREWLRGAKVDKNVIARALGMESSRFIVFSSYEDIDLNKITITKYDEKGMVIARHEEPR